jgi:uncharacterized protein
MGDAYIYTYILKIASRCNLNCTYCFVYNKGDGTWRNQPKFMSEDTLRLTCRRIVEHCKTHNQQDVHIILHGGEPLLGGISYLKDICHILQEELDNDDYPVGYELSIQSNGLLFTEEIGEFLVENNISIGVSIDGPPQVNDRTRVYHNGKPSTADLEKKLHLLAQEPYNSIFGGFLVVIDIEMNPIEVFDYLAQFNPWGMDFLLPYDNWDRRPNGKEDFESTPYADWLIKLYDYWMSINSPVKIKCFDSWMKVILGGQSTLESIGLSPVDIVVVETNGDIEAVDSLKASFEGATQLGLNISQHTFDDAMHHTNVRMRMEGTKGLCDTCKDCYIVDFCGSGYIPNRYSKERMFDNPSIYCRDLEKIINHIYAVVQEKMTCFELNETV